MSGRRALVDHVITKNKYFMVKTISVRGPTLARLAMVLVLLSIGNTPALWQSCGKPSTRFPHGGRVECLFIWHFQFLNFLEFLWNFKCQENHDFSLNLIFWNFQNCWNIMGLVVALPSLSFITSILISSIFRTRNPRRFLVCHRANHCCLDKVLH